MNNVFAITIEEGITKIDQSAFRACSVEYITLPESLKEKVYIVPFGTQIIGELAFAWNDQITEIVLQEGVKEIKGEAFSSCNSLQKVVMPASVEKIELDFDIMETFDSMSPWYTEKKGTFILEAPKNSYAIKFAKQNNIKYIEK